MSIDYARMNREFPKQKRRLTIAQRSADPKANVLKECQRVVTEWDEIGAWPDDWARWQRALDDVMPFANSYFLEDMRA